MTKVFRATIWEKAEHWTFEAKVAARDEISARKALAKEYPKRGYSIRAIGTYFEDQPENRSI